MLYYTLFVMIPSILPHINTNKGEVKPHKPQHHRATEHIDQREGVVGALWCWGSL